MKYFNKCHSILVSLIALAYIGTTVEQAKAATLVSQTWITNDQSISVYTVESNGIFGVPKKGGGEVLLVCTHTKENDPCSFTIRDSRQEQGSITYDYPDTYYVSPPNGSDSQKLSGTIDSGTGRFEIEVSGIEGLFSNSVVTADLINSTGFNATIGRPGDQLSQGGTISFSTQWFSDQPIGVDPLTGDEIILGEFFLDSTGPLTAFEYNVTNPDTPLISSTFTSGEKYRFSSGLEIDGTVTEQFETVPEPTTILGSGLALGLGALFKKKFPKNRRKLNKKLNLP